MPSELNKIGINEKQKSKKINLIFNLVSSSISVQLLS